MRYEYISERFIVLISSYFLTVIFKIEYSLSIIMDFPLNKLIKGDDEVIHYAEHCTITYDYKIVLII